MKIEFLEFDIPPIDMDFIKFQDECFEALIKACSAYGIPKEYFSSREIKNEK